MKILSGWRKIASHLHQGVRTVQRWELVGLPVHRPKAGPRSQVIAFEEELDVWAEAAPTGVFSTIAELKVKIARLEEELRALKQQTKEGGRYQQSAKNAHIRGDAARARFARYSQDLTRMTKGARDAANNLSASNNRHRDRSAVRRGRKH